MKHPGRVRFLFGVIPRYARYLTAQVVLSLALCSVPAEAQNSRNPPPMGGGVADWLVCRDSGMVSTAEGIVATNGIELIKDFTRDNCYVIVSSLRSARTEGSFLVFVDARGRVFASQTPKPILTHAATEELRRESARVAWNDSIMTIQREKDSALLADRTLKAKERRAAMTRRERSIRAQHWAPAFETAVLGEQITLGMTSTMVLTSWGKPSEVNRTTTVSGVHEQWIYPSRRTYVYLEEGVVSGIQESTSVQ